MKKSQILAALALAFALGVVAPVAGANAKVVGDDNTTGSVTTAQMNALNKEMLATDRAYNGLDYAQEYIKLYNDINGEDGRAADILKTVNDHFDTVVNNYNAKRGAFNFDTVNGYIDTVNYNLYEGDNLYKRQNDASGVLRYVNVNTAPTELGDATLRGLNKLGRVNSIKEAYDAIKALYDNAKENQVILWANYKNPSTTGSVTANMISRYYVIEQACAAWLSDVASYFSQTSPVNIKGMIWTMTQDIKAISQDAYNTLTNSEAWVDARDNKIGNTISLFHATQFQLALNAARALPKYSVSGQLAAAKTNYDKINSSTAVDYNVALSYVKAMNAAIANFKAGRVDTTTPGDDQNGDDINVRPGNTGVVAGAEGTASTTVSIVAGLATALTALGAGVVVYRNARRSSEN